MAYSVIIRCRPVKVVVGKEAVRVLDERVEAVLHRLVPPKIAGVQWSSCAGFLAFGFGFQQDSNKEKPSNRQTWSEVTPLRWVQGPTPLRSCLSVSS